MMAAWLSAGAAVAATVVASAAVPLVTASVAFTTVAYVRQQSQVTGCRSLDCFLKNEYYHRYTSETILYIFFSFRTILYLEHISVYLDNFCV